jgi:hypothetical protein
VASTWYYINLKSTKFLLEGVAMQNAAPILQYRNGDLKIVDDLDDYEKG